MGLEDKWKEAEKKLEDFNKSMKLIKQFPVKQFYYSKPSSVYEIEPPIEYPQSSSLK